MSEERAIPTELHDATKREQAHPHVRVFIATEIAADFPECSIMEPVQIGAALAEERLADVLGDDAGDNISDQADRYCELSVQYWAWKNVDADYVGFMLHHRYLNFSGAYCRENPFGEIVEDYVDVDAAQRYGLDEAHVLAALDGYDILTTKLQHVRSIPGGNTTPLERYEHEPYCKGSDVDRIYRIMAAQQPDYVEDFVDYLAGHKTRLCNLYVMRQDIFHAYCAWLFPMLEEFCKEDASRESIMSLRAPARLAEMLLNVFLAHAERTGAGWRVGMLQRVVFEHPEATPPLRPVWEQRADVDPDTVVPIVLASDDSYVPMLATTIVSILDHADPARFYDLVVFQKDISWRHLNQLREWVAGWPNAQVRFYDVRHMVSGYGLATSNGHISTETYYRFLIQDVLPGYDKVLYLDCDLIAEADVAKLFDTDVTGMLLAAAPDIDFVGNVCYADGERLAYAKDVLGLADPFAYFQAGVLVLNEAELRSLHTVSEWLQLADTSDFIYDDQDILNAECQGRVVPLAPEWNVMHDHAGRWGTVFSFAPRSFFNDYITAREAPRIIHYAGEEKPWRNPDCDYAPQFWHYARRMPFYEALMLKMALDAVERRDQPKTQVRDPRQPGQKAAKGLGFLASLLH